MRRMVSAGLAILVFAGALAVASADVLPGKYRIEPVMRGVDRAEEVAFAPDGRVFILERTSGKVRVMQHGKLLTDPFVQLSVASGSEEGLLGIALHPDFASNGWVYVFYTQASPKTNRIVRYTASGNKGINPFVVLDNIGAAANGEDNGGSLVFGADGKLYAGVGVLGVDGDAQSMSKLSGKVLRINPDGTVPADNPNMGNPYPNNLIYAVGARNPTDLGLNRNVGTLYCTDNYDTDAACDETDVVARGDNLGWNSASCGNGGNKAPLHSITPQLGVSGLASYTGGRYPGFDNSVFVAGSAQGKILRDVLGGAAFDSLTSSESFYDPTTDADCPTTLSDLMVGKDGWMYATSASTSGSVAGLYRVIYDNYGGVNGLDARPREVSATPYAPLTVERTASGLKLYWEDLKADSWGCTNGTTPKHCPTGSRETRYSVWQGDLVAPFDNHTVIAETNGVDVNDALMSHELASVPSGNRYFLVSARGANLEGPTGYSSGGAERRGYAAVDRCGGSGIALGAGIDKCNAAWPLTYPDPTNQRWNVSDLRGRTIFMSFAQFG